MTLTVAEGQRHGGTAASGGVTISGVNNDVIQVQDEFTVIEWLAITGFSGATTYAVDIVDSPSGANSLVQNLLVYGYTSGTAAVIVRDVGTVRNCVFYDGYKGAYAYGAGSNAMIENVTVYDMDGDCIDVNAGSTASIRNCIALGAGEFDLDLDGTVAYCGYTMYSSWNGQDPESFDGNNQTPPADLNDLFYSIAASSENLHLEDSGHNALDTGL
ncbi:MAG: right-handed parallel beta-helix repeat-containing protein, partial [Planctomycetota bacterium]